MFFFDCQYEERGETFLDEIQGDFAFVVSGPNGFLAARDPIGVVLYQYFFVFDKHEFFVVSQKHQIIEECFFLIYPNFDSKRDLIFSSNSQMSKKNYIF
jgi:asparagine synthetase B (glutamine-hydrolysing)